MLEIRVFNLLYTFSEPKRELFIRRREKDVVRNSTAAEILLKKLQSTQRKRTYHDPGFKPKKLVRVRPRVKSLQELKAEAENSTNIIGSPILTSNVLLLADKQNVAPQGSQPFDWSHRQERFRTRFNLFKPTTSTTTSTTEKAEEKLVVTPTNQPEEASTEVHVVTSISDELGPVSTTSESKTSTTSESKTSTTSEASLSSKPTSGSYQFISLGNENAKDNVLELERLFLNEKLNPEPEEDSDKIKRKVQSNPGFFKHTKPVQVGSSVTVINRFEPSTQPPTKYKAPSEGFGFEPELKDLVQDKSIDNEEDYEYEEDVEDKMDLDDMIIKAVEEALAIQVPQDPMIRYRGKDTVKVSSFSEKDHKIPKKII